MIKKLAITLPFICIILSAQAQTKHRYKDMVFEQVTVDKDQSYRPDAPKDEKKAYLFDLYQPTGDKEKARPLIIWMHGGGFKFDSKTAKGVVLWSNTFAQRGYVCASINYSLSKKWPIFHFDEFLKSTYNAVQDAKAAMAYFRKNAALYHIDPDKIILAGNSAGGILALQAAYADNAELADKAQLPSDPAAVNMPHNRAKVAAIINMWGAMIDLNWLKNARVPIVSILGSKDSIIPPSDNGKSLYGGIDIHTKATELGIPNKLKVFDGYSHELEKHFDPVFAAGKPTQRRWLEAGQFAADFLYSTLYK